MSKSKHTPGPWDSGGTLEIVAGKWGEDCPTVAEAHCDLPRGLDGYANARLIAAAPQTLKERDAYMKVVKMVASGKHDAETLIDAACSALRHAKGE